MNLLIENIDRLHTTVRGVDRIQRNLKIDTEDVVGYCKNLILNPQCHIYRRGKNWYCEIGDIKITVNAYSYTIITAHTFSKDVQISHCFIDGDIKGAIAYMKDHDGFQDILPTFVSVFENCEYRTYEIPDNLNDILRLYQIYFRDIFYLDLPKNLAEDKLLKGLKSLLKMPNADELLLVKQLQSQFENEGYHALFGKTQGYYGPYIWKDTNSTTYNVELPDGVVEYTINILRGFVFRGWMDYLTFGRYGTGGWTLPDGTINCVEQAYDFKSERFLVSFLKHEAQHSVDMKQFPQITPTELEYRAKLVELYYSSDSGLLNKIISVANPNKMDDPHAIASSWIKQKFKDTALSRIQAQALELFHASTKEMKEKYGGQIYE
nr:DUF3781 domain-containing protein [uncultured Rummeliibacillus sp.]